MAKDFTNQHIVPKRYMDRFGRKDGKRTIIGTRITNKGNVKFFEDSTANVGYIKNYYDVTDKNDPKYWEHYFAREIDTMCGQAMENFITKTDLNSILCSGLFFIGSISKNSYCKQVNFHWLTNQGVL